MVLSASLTAAWLILAGLFLRYWDLTLRLESFPLWAGIFLAAYVVCVGALHQLRLVRDADVRRPVMVWAVLLVACAGGARAFPVVTLPSVTVQTVALMRVIDVVLPLWILHRGIYTVWSGQRRVQRPVTALTPICLLWAVWFLSIRMPGESHAGGLDPLTVQQVQLREALRGHVTVLADSIGARGSRQPDAVARAVAYLRDELEKQGLTVLVREYPVGDTEHANLEVTIEGGVRANEVVVVGAHYDTYDLTPGADDNATGTAAVLELARRFAGEQPERTLRFVLFGTEEPPHFNTENMGSRWYAARARAEEVDVVAMISLEMLGYFDDTPGSQNHPPPMQLFFPDRGDFIAFVGNPASGTLLRRSLSAFRTSTRFPSEGVVSSSMVPGVELSDHASFWREGFPAIVVSDTGPFRNVYYHRSADRPESLDFDRMARVVWGLSYVIAEIAGVGLSID